MLVVRVAEFGEVNGLAFSPDGVLLAARLRYTSVSLWDAVTGARHSRQPVGFVDGAHVGFHPSGRWLFGSTPTGELAAFDPHTGEAHAARLGEWDVDLVVPTSSGDRVFVYYRVHGAHMRNAFASWKWTPGESPPVREWHALPYSKTVMGWGCGLTVLAGGERVVTVAARQDHSPRITVRDARTGQTIRGQQLDGVGIPIVAASPASDAIAAVVTTNLYATDRAKLTLRATNGRKHFTAIAFHPSGKYLAATSNDETVKLFDTQTWQVAKTFSWDIGRLRSVAFSPDGTRAAVGSDTGQVVVWDVDV